jgi:hypothetical protein
MGNKAITKEARRAARVAAAVAQDELVRRTRANVEDLATFFTARERADAVDDWLAERQQVLRGHAAARRREHRVQCGQALRAMRDRGESVREIARMAGVAEKTVRELIREADAAPNGDGAQAGPPVAGGPPGPTEVAGQSGSAELGAPVLPATVAAGEPLEAGARV